MMTLSVIGSAALDRADGSLDWPAIQWAQFEHDEKYHREISRLSMQDRLRHMALHFAKYAGRLSDHPDEKIVKQTTVDTLIIGVSCANVLNMDLSKKSLRAACKETDFNEFLRSLAVAAGKMAGACERIDHLEDFPFRKAIAEQVEVILAVTIAFMGRNGWDIVSEVENRLAGVKAKSIFHGKL